MTSALPDDVSLRGARRGAKAQRDQGGDGETEDRMSVRHELAYRNQAEDPKRKLVVVMIVSLFRAGGVVDADRDGSRRSQCEPGAQREGNQKGCEPRQAAKSRQQCLVLRNVR